jgi:hypothetical protein
MSAAEHQSRNESSQADQPSLTPPLQRPSLLQPPPRPTPPSEQPAEVKVEAASKPQRPAATPAPAPSEAPQENETIADSSESKATFKNHPIAPPSEPMQYRAIGLVRGTYHPDEEQLNRGNIIAEDGAVIDAVLLGRVTSLIKKHIDLDSSHLWVVYPRTRQPNEETDETDDSSQGNLHLQIVGVWEPETLGLPGENPRQSDEDEDDNEDDNSEAVSEEDTLTTTAPPPTAHIAEPDDTSAAIAEPPLDNYFSIRGEILNYDEESEKILVKIVQGAKRSGKPPKAFKLNVSGEISGKTVGYFWELEVTRQGEDLVLTEGRPIGIVPPKKRKNKGKFSGARKGGGRRPTGGLGADRKPKPARSKDKPRIRPSAPVKSNPL